MAHLRREGPEFGTDLARFAGVCRTVRGLRSARLGAMGAHRRLPDHALQRKLLQAAGVTVITADLSELIGAVAALADDDAAVAQATGAIAGYGTVPAHIRPEQIAKQAKWTVAVKRWIAENECDASAIQCWRSLQDKWGCATCVTTAMLGEGLMPSACEVAAMGVLSMCALALASGSPLAILDWNNNYARRRASASAPTAATSPRPPRAPRSRSARSTSWAGRSAVQALRRRQGQGARGPHDLLSPVLRRRGGHAQRLGRRGRVHRTTPSRWMAASR